MDHFKGIIPEERWKNDMLNELRKIRELLGRDAQTIKQEPEVKREVTPRIEKRPYRKRGAS